VTELLVPLQGVLSILNLIVMMIIVPRIMVLGLLVLSLVVPTLMVTELLVPGRGVLSNMQLGLLELLAMRFMVLRLVVPLVRCALPSSLLTHVAWCSNSASAPVVRYMTRSVNRSPGCILYCGDLICIIGIYRTETVLLSVCRFLYLFLIFLYLDQSF